MPQSYHRGRECKRLRPNNILKENPSGSWCGDELSQQPALVAFMAIA
jgi:hypothetical protein